MKKVFVTWNAYLKLIDKLSKSINWQKENFEKIIAINRGGNIIGTILSHKTGIPLLIINAQDEIPHYLRKVLIVDEISDTGCTFLKVTAHMCCDTQYKTASLHIKSNTKFIPSFFVSKIDKWIVYPYENEEKS